MRFFPNSNQLCLPAKGAQDERRQDIADRVHGKLRWFAQCGEGNYHGELHSVYCPVLYGVCQPDVTFEFVTLTADQEERSNRIDQLQTEMMAGQGPDIFILPCDDGFGFNETRLIENVEKGMVTGLFADLTTLYNQDETLQKDVLLEKVMDAGVMDDKRYILPLRYQYPIILSWRTSCKRQGWKISELSQNSETFLSTVLSQKKSAWHVSGANVFAANLINVFPSLCDYSTGRFPWTRKQLSQPFPSIWSCFPPWTRRALRLMVGFGPISYPLTDL